MKRVLSIQDLSCMGKCSLTVALPVLSVMGCAATALPTGVLSTHTAFPQPHVKDMTGDILPICRHWQQVGAEFDGITVGYLSDPTQAEAVKEVLDAFPAFTVIDPVMGDNGKPYSRITEDHVRAMKALCAKGNVLLPNVTEACMLTGMPYREKGDEGWFKELLDAMGGFGAEAVIITGAATAEDRLGYAGSWKKEVFTYQARRLPGQYHGTGDLFAAAFTGGVMNGLPIPESAKLAASFVERVIGATPEASPFGVNFETQLPWLQKQL